ncbi:hypothetical protein WJU16_03065 [Chitinophaga pollutisoli]|uniref:Uncharacterized protein n=1 Tax=Chitinophaga pollutisoli TaxID=3133966 RepID=A0ABZ2YQE5_9BACT
MKALICVLSLLLLISSPFANAQDQTNGPAIERTHLVGDGDFAKSVRQIERAVARIKLRCKKRLAQNDSLHNSTWTRINISTTDSLNSVLRNLKGFDAAQYIGKLDSLQILNKLAQSGSIIISPSQQDALSVVLKHLQLRNQELVQATIVLNWVKQQKDAYQSFLLSNGMLREAKQLRDMLSKWRSRAESIRTELENPGRSAVDLLHRAKQFPIFQEFFRKHSQLASLFQLPGGEQVSSVAAGLQTRSDVFELLQQRTAMAGPRGPDILSQSINSGYTELKNIQEKVNKVGGLSDEDMEAVTFKPSTTRTKTFLQRLEYGSDFQSLPSKSSLPATSDLGVSVGYKLNEKSVVGIGLSYKMGWGESWRRIRLSSQGMGLRSFVDVKAWRTFFLTGGFEYNYQPISSALIPEMDISDWTKSALMGLTSIVPLKSKISKRAKVQLLWDAMAARQGRQALKFRIGYSF